jgi:hypothetical protein
MKEEKTSHESDLFMACPLCSYRHRTDDMESASAATDQELLHQHITNQLHSLALKSLPPLSSEGASGMERGQLSRGVVDSRLDPYKLMVPIWNEAYPQPRYHDPGITTGFGQGIRGLPENFDRLAPPAPRGNSKDITLGPGRVWRPQEKQTGATESYNVLLVEDNIVNQKIFSKFVGRLHHVLVIANNGLEGLNTIKQRRYDIIFMDIAMPTMVSKRRFVTSQDINNRAGRT